MLRTVLTDPRRRAFTLVEMLMAAAILALALVAICELFVVARITEGRGNYSTNAAGYCQSTLETAAGAGYSALIDGTTTGSLSNLPSGNAVTTLIRPLDGDPKYQFIKEVRLTMTWPSGTEAPMQAGSFQATTLISAKR